MNLAVWEVRGAGPVRLSPSDVDLEKHLEDWIEADPGLLQGGLTIVGRQTVTGAGPLDLLAIDEAGMLSVIELKRGGVTRETIAQAIDYASCIAFMPTEELVRKADEYLKKRKGAPTFEDLLSARKLALDEMEEPRPVGVVVVGVGREPGLERIVNFLSDSAHPFTLVAYSSFKTAGGAQVLVRELTEGEGDARAAEAAWSVEQVLEKADQLGTGKLFRGIHGAAIRHNLHARPWKHAIMYAPHANRRRCLFTVTSNPSPGGGPWVYVAGDAFTEFFELPAGKVKELLGPTEWQPLSPDGVARLIRGLDSLLAPPAGSDQPVAPPAVP